MNKIISGIAFLLLFLVGISCQNQVKKVKPVFKQVESLMEQEPDSVLILLQEIPEVEKLKEDVFYKFLLFRIQARYKSYKDISNDTLIFKVRDFYHQKKDIANGALATFYCGRVFQERKDYENALKQFLEAKTDFQQGNDLHLLGLCQEAIASIYYKQLLYEKAINHYIKAESHYEQAGSYSNQTIANKFAGNCFLIMGKKDSAVYYYQKGIEKADKYKVVRQQVELRQGLGVVYREMQDWEQSIYYINEALQFSPDSLNKAKLASNLAFVNQLKGNNSQAIYHMKQAMRYLPAGENNVLKANIYRTWSKIEEKSDNYQNALNKYKLYSKHLSQVVSDNKNSAILEIEEKYNFQVVESQNKQLKIERQQVWLLSLVLLLIIIILLLVFLVITIRTERKLKEAESKIIEMRALVRNYNETEISFRNALIRHFDIIRKTALMEKYLKEDERKIGERLLSKFNEVVYEKKTIDWEQMFATLNDVSNGYFTHLKERLSELGPSDFRICCLIFAGFSNSEIALFLDYRINTVEVKKSRIRKKLGLESRTDIVDYLKE